MSSLPLRHPLQLLPHANSAQAVYLPCSLESAGFLQLYHLIVLSQRRNRIWSSEYFRKRSRSLWCNIYYCCRVTTTSYNLLNPEHSRTSFSRVHDIYNDRRQR
jgi:hypothetical protein